MSSNTTDNAQDQGSLERYGAQPTDACTNYEDCQNTTPGTPDAGNSLCTSCLDTARYQDSPLPEPTMEADTE